LSFSYKDSLSEDGGTAFSIDKIVLLNDKMEEVKSFDETKVTYSMKIKTKGYIIWDNEIPFDYYFDFLAVDNGFFLSKFSDNEILLEKFDFSGRKVMEIKKRCRKKPFKDQKDKDFYGFTKSYEKNKWYESRKYKRSVTGLFEDGKQRLWVATPNDEKKKGIKFYVFEDGIYKFSTVIDLKVTSEYLFFNNGGISFVGDKLYLFNFSDDFGVKCYNIIEE
ncbi:MAG: hypothetical protein CSA15_13490, partial [Candidatus Delongbacteria bacterium]